MLGVWRRLPALRVERFGADIKQNLEMTEEFCDILDLAFSQDSSVTTASIIKCGDPHPGAPGAETGAAMLLATPRRCSRAGRRHGYRVLSSGRVGGAKLLAEQYADIRRSLRGGERAVSECTHHRQPLRHITDSREEGCGLRECALPEPARLEPAAPAGGHAGHRIGWTCRSPASPPLKRSTTIC